MVTSFVRLFRPPSDHASFQIKKKPYSRLNMKWEDSSLLYKDIDIAVTTLLSGCNKQYIIKNVLL